MDRTIYGYSGKSTAKNVFPRKNEVLPYGVGRFEFVLCFDSTETDCFVIFNSIVWFADCRKGDLAKLEKNHAKIITGIQKDLGGDCKKKIVHKAKEN